MAAVSVTEQARALLHDQRPLDAYRVVLAALDATPGDPVLARLAGTCMQAVGDASQAERWWRQALQGLPDDADLHFNLALLLACGERRSEALEHFATAADLAPDDLEIQANLGLALAAAGQDEAAQPALRAGLLAPDPAPVHLALADLLARRGQVDAAEQHYRSAVALAPDDATAPANLALLLAGQQRDEEAEDWYRLALSLAPDEARIHANLAGLLTQQGRLVEAEAAYRRALALDPRDPLTHSNLGVLLAGQARDAEAENAFITALATVPGHPRARLNRAFLLLARGQWRPGWVEHETRFDPHLKYPTLRPAHLPGQRWQGQSLAGQSILLWLEQGYGDQIQFCRYAMRLKQMGAARVAVACQPVLVTLLRSLGGVDQVLAHTDTQAAGLRFDYWAMSMDVPRHGGGTPETWPASLPYLAPDPAHRARWQARLPDSGFKVGVCWRGNPLHHNDRQRSLPAVATLAPLARIPGIHWISLQPGTQPSAPEGMALLPLGAEFEDFADTAAVIDQLDLVISVDSAVAHLAGALACPCWVLLPAIGTDWRWQRERGDSPWYPETMRLFRQDQPGDWSGPLAEMAGQLATLVAAPR
ncbi:tetratricopeptide repeat protein [Chitiniphilus eburneus]|uniref:Tetratricopeptide repeat protein n=1 Tax=Chitiniphilus eburneus TaxID=2571148 RepID=A0A4U0Q8G2_9NEIS|nr:tetratricopeptide repeat-containing glycosyltransferase family protein [Chitiniphilus eburneus]TJZ77475.1 tetratricopeptide repeat protein [Chitiniphilus eburneus]